MDSSSRNSLPESTDAIWSKLQSEQGNLNRLGYTFAVSHLHYAVYKNDEPIFGLCNKDEEDKELAIFSNWSAAIATAIAHARIYRAYSPVATPQSLVQHEAIPVIYPTTFDQGL